MGDAVNLIDSKNYDNLSVKPRKSLETLVILTECLSTVDVCSNDILCYFSREDKWCSLGKRHDDTLRNIRRTKNGQSVYCRGKLYYLPLFGLTRLESYNSYSNCWTSLSYKDDREMWQIFVRNEDEMYALVEDCHREFDTSQDRRKCVSYITKYKPKSHSWEDISSFDYLDSRRNFCIVAKDNFIYFIGGEGWRDGGWKPLTYVDRYDLSRNQWDKVADMQEPKICS